MIRSDIIERLYSLQDVQYRDFQSKLIPNISADSVIGVRLPALKSLAKELSQREDIGEFLSALPHDLYEENQLHACIISLTKDFDVCLAQVEAFLPHVDNWATCDTLIPKVFKKRKTDLLPHIDNWLSSDKTYTVRFGIKMLMSHFLDDDFDVIYPEKVAKLRSEEYYINMMIAWYFATALAKQYDAVLPFIEKHALDAWTHNKAIQKAVESYRVAPEQKEYLKTLKVK